MLNMLFLNFNFQSNTITVFGAVRGGGGGAAGEHGYRTELRSHRHAEVAWTDLRGEPVTNSVHVVAGRRGAHEGVGVAGEAMAIGRQAVRSTAVGAQTPLVHGGRRQGLGSV